MNIVTDFTLRDYWRIIQKRKWIIIITTILVSGVVYWQVNQEIPIYTTSAGVKVEQVTTRLAVLEEIVTHGTGNYLETQKQMIVGDLVFERVGYRAGFIREEWLKKIHPDFEKRFEDTKIEPEVGHILQKVNPRLKPRRLRTTEPTDASAGADTSEAFAGDAERREIRRIVKRLRGNPEREGVKAGIDAQANILWVTVTKSQPSKYSGGEDTQRYVRILADLVIEEYKKESEYQSRKASTAHDEEVANTLKGIKSKIDVARVELQKLDIPYNPTERIRDLTNQLDFLDPQQAQLRVELSNRQQRANYLDAIKADIEVMVEKYETDFTDTPQIIDDSEKVRERASDLNRNFPEVYTGDSSLQELLEGMRLSEETIQNSLKTRTLFHPTVIQNQKQLVILIRRTVRRLYQLLVEAWLKETQNLVPIQEQYDTLLEKIAGIQTEKEYIEANVARYRELQDELDVNEDTYKRIQPEELKTRYRELVGGQQVEIVSRADEPSRAKTYKRTKVLAGGFVGVILGFIFAFVIESFDSSLDTVADLEEYLGVPVLGIIPSIAASKRMENFAVSIKNRIVERARTRFFGTPPKGPPAPLIATNPKSTIAEAMRSLRTNVMAQMILNNNEIEPLPNRRSICFVITSATPQEGKTTIAANLAITVAQLGKKTLLIDGDLRRPSLHRVFGVDNLPGITDLLIGGTSTTEAIRSATDLLFGTLQLDGFLDMPGIDNLQFLPAGTRPPTPSELIASSEMTYLLEELRQTYDVILIDISPTLPITDSIVLGPQTDGVLLVYRSGRATRQMPKRAIDMLKQSKANVLGVVLNEANPEIDPDIQYLTYSYDKEDKKNV